MLWGALLCAAALLRPRPRLALPAGGASRRSFLGYGAATVAGLAPVFAAHALPISDAQSKLVWQPSSELRPRSGDVRQLYPARFSTYLARFLLRYDQGSSQWWQTQGAALPLSGKRTELQQLRENQFSQFSESVAVGLGQFGGPQGPRQLYSLLRSRYGVSRQGKLQLAKLFTLLEAPTQPKDLIARALGTPHH